MTGLELKEIASVLGAIGGAASAIISYFVVRVRGQSAEALKKIDVSAEWQSQMLARISSVEAELQRERVRGDLLENQLFTARAEAHELQWKFAREQSERISLAEDMRKMHIENEALQRQNEALAAELHELNRQIRSGYTSLSSPPPAFKPAPPAPPKPRLPKNK